MPQTREIMRPVKIHRPTTVVVCVLVVGFVLCVNWKFHHETNERESRSRKDAGEMVLNRSRNVVYVRINITDKLYTNLTKLAKKQLPPPSRKNITLEEENFILVESKRKQLSRERQRQKRELMLLRSRTWEHIQAERKQRLRDVCEKRTELHTNLTRIIYENRRQLWPLIVNDEYKLIYAFTPSVASKFWKSAFHTLQGDAGFSSYATSKGGPFSNLRNLSSYEPHEIEHRLSSYTKFVFVRDPFVRVLSAFRRKVLPPNSKYTNKYGRLLSKNYRKLTASVLVNSNSNVTFREFARFVTKYADLYVEGDWYPLSKMILPCVINYDYIGTLESGSKDFVNVLQNTHIDHLVKYKPSTFQYSSHNGKVYDHYFLKLSPTQIRRLYRMYEADFELFGYDIPQYMHPWVFDKFRSGLK